MLAVLAVVAGTVAGGWIALDSYAADRALSVGSVRLAVEPGHRGALDVYVPLVDWGARFPVVRLPARLHVDVRAIDRDVAARIARGGALDAGRVRAEARDALASYLRELLGVTLASALALGLLTALAVRGRDLPRLRATAATAAVVAVGGTTGLGVLLAPRGDVGRPEYYARGSDVPRALEALDAVRRSTRALDQELDAQLVGLARLVVEPARRTPLRGRPRFLVASDVHNNVLALGLLERAAERGPLLFAGDLTDRGTPLEQALLLRVIRAGRPFVFVTGNHDSDVLARRIAGEGGIVLTERGRLRADGSHAEVVVRVGRLRVAGYGDRFERRAADGYADRYRDAGPSPLQQELFADWLFARLNRVDVVMVHDVRLAAVALARLRTGPPVRPLVLATGHTHVPSVRRQPGVTVVDGGSAGAGGTGNLADGGADLGVARVTYDARPRFRPLAVDLVQLDPATGSATARRERLDD
jgi:predicted phosphodiesterase